MTSYSVFPTHTHTHSLITHGCVVRVCVDCSFARSCVHTSFHVADVSHLIRVVRWFLGVCVCAESFSVVFYYYCYILQPFLASSSSLPSVRWVCVCTLLPNIRYFLLFIHSCVRSFVYFTYTHWYLDYMLQVDPICECDSVCANVSSFYKCSLPLLRFLYTFALKPKQMFILRFTFVNHVCTFHVHSRSHIPRERIKIITSNEAHTKAFWREN